MVTQELAATQKLQAGGDNVRKTHRTVMHLSLGTFLTPRLAPRGCSSQKGSVVTDHTTTHEDGDTWTWTSSREDASAYQCGKGPAAPRQKLCKGRSTTSHSAARLLHFSLRRQLCKGCSPSSAARLFRRAGLRKFLHAEAVQQLLLYGCSRPAVHAALKSKCSVSHYAGDNARQHAHNHASGAGASPTRLFGQRAALFDEDLRIEDGRGERSMCMNTHNTALIGRSFRD